MYTNVVDVDAFFRFSQLSERLQLLVVSPVNQPFVDVFAVRRKYDEICMEHWCSGNNFHFCRPNTWFGDIATAKVAHAIARFGKASRFLGCIQKWPFSSASGVLGSPSADDLSFGCNSCHHLLYSLHT